MDRECNHDLAALCGAVCTDCVLEAGNTGTPGEYRPMTDRIVSLAEIMWGGPLNVWIRN